MRDKSGRTASATTSEPAIPAAHTRRLVTLAEAEAEADADAADAAADAVAVSTRRADRDAEIARRLSELVGK